MQKSDLPWYTVIYVLDSVLCSYIQLYIWIGSDKLYSTARGSAVILLVYMLYSTGRGSSVIYAEQYS